MCISAQRKVCKIGKRSSTNFLINIAGTRISAHNMGHLDIEEVRRMEHLSAIK